MCNITRTLALASFVAVVGSGIGCKQEYGDRFLSGKPRFFDEATQSQVTTTAVEFGPTVLKTKNTREVTIRNYGPVNFTIVKANASDGLSPAFDFDRDPVEVKATEEVVFHVQFVPIQPGGVSGTITLDIANGDLPNLTIELHGLGVAGDCELSEQTLEFRPTAVNSTSLRTLTIHNRSAASFSVDLPPVSNQGASVAFSFLYGFEPGVHTVPAANSDGTPGELLIPVAFSPLHALTYSGALTITEPSFCPSSVALSGTGVAEALACEPSVEIDGSRVCRVDFGFVNPGAKVTRSVSFRNFAERPITLTLESVTQPASGGAPFALENSPQSFVVPIDGPEVAIDLSFLPSELGEQFGRLNLTSDDPNRPRLSVDLVGVGGGPAIDAQPAQLDFGMTAIDTYQKRRIVISNVGTNVAGSDRDNLILALADGTGWTEKRPEITGPDAADFSLEWPPQGYTADGLAEGQSADLRIRFAPMTDGRKNATVVIYSNDPDQPTLEILITGRAANLPPCDFDLVAPTMEFGRVVSNTYLTESLAIVNRDPDPTHECLVASLDLTRDTYQSGAFQLKDGPIESATIAGGASLIVPVRFKPLTDGTYAGELKFYISSPTRPEVTVPLHGIAAPSCLMFAPREYDFGPVGINCNSRQRPITIYNTCYSTIMITAIDRQGGSSEFAVTRRPALPMAIPGGGSSDFGLTYHPSDAGQDFANVAVTISGAVPTYLISLTGTGTTDPIQTDVVTLAPIPKVDVLMIVDDSCSQNIQTSLAANFSTFIQPAVQSNADYHLAITTTSIDGPTFPCGRFVPLTGSNPRVITPSTPNKEQIFSQNVQVGTTGSGTESLIRPAYLALTNPLINGYNAGFYRDEAKLAVVVVSDAADQDPNATPVSFYESFFLNLKGTKRRNDFTFSGIIPTLANGPGAGCSYDSNDAGQDQRVKQLIQASGGFMDEVCTSDWSQTMGNLGTHVFATANTTVFFLTSTPDMTAVDPIVITVNGLQVAQYGSHGDKRWDYDAGTNSIVFTPLAVPDPGSTITIRYRVACL